MSKPILLLLLSFVLAVLFWHIPVQSSALSPPIIENFATSLREPDSSGPRKFVWHRLLSNNKHELISLDAAGKIVSRITLPPNKISSENGEEVKVGNVEGYLTYPVNGEYYLWYPQLGRQIAFFDESGRFIWERSESRYLQAFPDGKYLLAAAGDHSRVEFLTPNLDPLIAAEGLMFIDYLLDGSSESEWHAAIVFIDGIVQLFNLEKKVSVKIDFQSIVKSAHVDLQTGVIMAQVEEKYKVENNELIRDSLLITKPLKAAELEVNRETENQTEVNRNASIDYSIPLSGTYPVTLPLLSNAELNAVVLPGPKLSVFGKNQELLWEQKIPDQPENVNIEDWQLISADEGGFLWSPQIILWYDRSGIRWIKKIPETYKFVRHRNTILIQSEESVFSYKINSQKADL